MNFLKLKFGLISLLIVFAISAFLTSCEKDIVQEEATKPIKNYTGNDLRIYNFFEEMGLEMTELEIKDKLVVYGDDGHCADMRWIKSSIMKHLNDQVDLRQRGFHGLYDFTAVPANKVNDIKYKIQESVQNHCGMFWYNAIGDAIEEWNNLTNCRVNFREVTDDSETDLFFYSERDPSNPLGVLASNEKAGAAIATNAAPGSAIAISTDHAGHTTKKQTIMHEIGHVLGFGHTDGLNTLLPTYVIPGTPTTDANSIMNHGGSSGFSNDDKTAFKMYYPENLYAPSDLSVRWVYPSTLRVTCKNPSYNNNKPYFWLKLGWKSNTLNVSGVKYLVFDVNSSGYASLEFPLPGFAGGFSITVKGTNYKRDIESPATSLSIESTPFMTEGGTNIIQIAEPSSTTEDLSGLHMAEGLNGKKVVFKSMKGRNSNTEDHNLLYSTNPDDTAGEYLTIESAPDGNYYNPNYKVLGISNYASDDIVFKLHATDNGRYLIEGANGKFASHQKFIEFYRTYNEAKTKDDCKFQILMHPHKPGHYFIYKMDKGYLTPKGHNPARLKLVTRSQEQEFIMMDADEALNATNTSTNSDVFNPSSTENQSVFMQAYGFGGDQSNNLSLSRVMKHLKAILQYIKIVMEHIV